MARKVKVSGELKSKARLRSEIVEAFHGLHKIGAVGDAELAKRRPIRARRDTVFADEANLPLSALDPP
jgi:hypothetical protein